MKRITKAWIEDTNKLCVRWEPDTGAETLGLFHPHKHSIVASDFLGKSPTEACALFNSIVYPEYGDTRCQE